MESEEPLPVTAMKRYWYHLERDEFREAADQFTEDTMYLHPPMHKGISEVYGREELYDYFVNARGPRESSHEVTHYVSDGTSAVIQGRVFGPDVDVPHVFMVYTEVRDGKIAYYSAVNRDETESERVVEDSLG
ncbi:hypothetical protein GJR96_15695 [Haloferax sp. MBLA0076]|uniref:SnoaL-like domain-containing protein n=1 Tax=Haloferax litoreum TaxID=2666140 RepID=A0A6A8GJW8_9EURY|nr:MULTISPECIES: nuclear transport factor 2 family protein [Haloferax]KAB1190421.1 nuclear transport factor 2 family protein [Haloferax sp. CBA1148]MRX23395.1 hypothetical protein [Haloferax litoreum]